MAAPTERQVAEWMTRLGPMVASNMTAEDAVQRLKAYVPELARRYGSECFDSVSREHVARHCRFFPSYGELCELLDNLPSRAPVPALAGPDRDGLDAMDRRWLEFWYRRLGELDLQQGGFRWGSREADVESLASLVRAQSLKAWRVISPESIVIQDRPTEQQVAEVARKLAMAGITQPSRPFPPEAPRGTGHAPVSPAELERMRLARGVRVPA